MVLKLSLMVAKPLLKRVIKSVIKGRKDIRDYRKKSALKNKLDTAKKTATLNNAQERYETLKEVKQVTLGAMKHLKVPKEGREAFSETFKIALKKRRNTRNTLMDPKYLNTKSNRLGGIINQEKKLLARNNEVSDHKNTMDYYKDIL